MTDAMRDSSDERGWPDEGVSEFLDQMTAGGHDYRQLVERLPVVVYTAEPGENGRWRYVSPQVEKILGYAAEEFMADPDALGAPAAPRGPRAGAREPKPRHPPDDRSSAAVEYRMRHPHAARRSGSSTRPCSRPTKRATPVWHGVLYDISERKQAEQELQRALSQQAVVAKLGERALQDGDPEALMRAAASADRRDRRRPAAPASGSSAATAAASTSAPGSRTRSSAPGAASPPPATPTPAPRSTPGARTIVDDWAKREPLHDAAGAAGRRRRQQPGGDDRRQATGPSACSTSTPPSPSASPQRTPPSSRPSPTFSPTRSSATPPTRRSATASCTTR